MGWGDGTGWGYDEMMGAQRRSDLRRVRCRRARRIRSLQRNERASRRALQASTEATNGRSDEHRPRLPNAQHRHAQAFQQPRRSITSRPLPSPPGETLPQLSEAWDRARVSETDRGPLVRGSRPGRWAVKARNRKKERDRQLAAARPCRPSVCPFVPATQKTKKAWTGAGWWVVVVGGRCGSSLTNPDQGMISTTASFFPQPKQQNGAKRRRE